MVAYCVASCSAIAAISSSGDSTLMVAVSVPAGRAHQIEPRRQPSLTTHSSHAGYIGRRMASCCSAQSVFTQRRYIRQSRYTRQSEHYGQSAQLRQRLRSWARATRQGAGAT